MHSELRRNDLKTQLIHPSSDKCPITSQIRSSTDICRRNLISNKSQPINKYALLDVF